MYHCLHSASHGQPFLLPLHHVREVVPFASLKTVEGAPPDPMIKGWVAYHQSRLPILNSNTWGYSAGRKPNQPAADHLAVLSIYGALIGLETDGIGQIRHLARESLLPPSPHLSSDHGVLACVAGASDELIPLLDLHGLLRRQTGKDLPGKEDIDLSVILPDHDTPEIEPLLATLSQTVRRLVCLNPDEALNTEGRIVLSLHVTPSRLITEQQTGGIPLCRIIALTGGPTHLTRACSYLEGADLLLDGDPQTAAADILSAVDLSLLLH